MTRVCLLGAEDVNLEYELLSHETSRNALATYDLREPYDNSVALETVSLGAAVALLNDLNWYLVRFVEDVLVFEPSVSESEWLSRDAATAVRDDELAPEETDRYLKIYGVVEPETDALDDQSESEDEPDTDGNAGQDRPPRLVEPMFVTRTGPDLPEYDLRDVEETLVVRVTESEFGA
ncbi:DUF5804 family protein [Halapricum desulfuricans]|uniref:Uncharacterized protein n=1 Tax=Halapricum desulfuricans TaxID=2841257 RepID=A0A897N144_9EURY|nr:DUF5804 family protein [Halapricum desulfuricans]QSG06427.1 Uncharacterized protein HSR121_2096 [Halapricum desulfuricans]